MGDRTEARGAVGDGDADVAAALALHADALTGDPRPAALQECRDDLEQLRLVDRAAAQLEVDRDVGGDRRWSCPGSRRTPGARRRSARNSATSAKLRSAWMPPAVAQAPIVTSRRELCRICWMRSASSAVVTDPSTSERS